MIILQASETQIGIDAGLFNNTIKDKVKSICENHKKENTSSYYFCNVTTLLAFEVYCKQYNIELKVYNDNMEKINNLEEIYSVFAIPFLELDAMKEEY